MSASSTVIQQQQELLREQQQQQQKVDDAQRPFRVIVVGGGVAGLAAAHCLHKAGIEHVVLERRGEIAPPEGASIAIYPHGARILHQIGCLEAAQQACVPCDRFYSRSPDGSTLTNSGFFHHVRENHGLDILVLERRKFLSILYACLPDRSRVRTACEVVDIRQHASGVEVVLGDGSVEVGDVVVGADGVHSHVRSLMWAHANLAHPGSVPVAEKTRLRTRWKCLVGMGPAAPELGARDMTAVHNDGFSFLALTQPDAVFFFVFLRLPPHEQVRWPRRAARCSAADADDLAARVADRAVAPTLVFGELWARRLRGGLVPIEEGVLERWHAGRVVLAGDAAHKVTPNIALGGNTALESVAVLVNHLAAVMRRQQGARPSLHTLSRALCAYQDDRRARVVAVMRFSALITGLQAWDSRLHRFVASWVLPWLPDRMVADQMARMIRSAPCLDFVALTGLPSGRVAWADQEDQEDHGETATSGGYKNKEELERQKQKQKQKQKQQQVKLQGGPPRVGDHGRWAGRLGGLAAMVVLVYTAYFFYALSHAAHMIKVETAGLLKT